MKVLISSYAFTPEAASEPGAGWAFARAAAAHHDVWVATATDNRPAIEAFRRDHPERWPDLQLVYIDRPRRGPEQIRYAGWQRALGRRVSSLHRQVGFDVAHHVTLAIDWLPTGLDGIDDLPFVWGPVGGVPPMPWHLVRWLGPRGAARELLHSAVTGLGRRSAGRRTASRASLAVGANPEFRRRFPGLPLVEIETNSAIDLATLPPRVLPVEGPRRAVFAGRLLSWKGLSLAIAALAHPEARDWTLTVLGDGPDGARNRRLAEAWGVADRVEFRGLVDRDRVLEYFAAADALLLPTMHDAGPWVVAEAVSIGCPAVCLDWGGPAYLLEQGGGRLVPTRGDVPGNLARALAALPRGSGEPSARYDQDRFPALLDAWYRAAVGEVARDAADPSSTGPGASIARTDLLGVGISAIDPAMALDEITRWVDEGLRSYVCVTGVHGVMESQDDPELRRIHNESGLTTPDGMPMVWASHWAGNEQVSRVYGPDLMLAVCERAAARGWRSFFYGGAEGVAEQVGAEMQRRFPGFEVGGAYSPPFRDLTPAEDDEVVRMINDARPDLVWVGLSTPKQERWMAAHRDRLDAAALLGVGAAFDFHTGRVTQAPRWMQRSGLEWAYRLATEPRRLWRRYLTNNPRFVWAVARRPPTRRGP